MSDFRPVILTCQDGRCPGNVRFVDPEQTDGKGKYLIEGQCSVCDKNQLIVYELIKMSAIIRAIEVRKTHDLSDEHLEWIEYHDKKGKKLGYIMDGAVRIDMGPFHLANDLEIEREGWEEL